MAGGGIYSFFMFTYLWTACVHCPLFVYSVTLCTYVWPKHVVEFTSSKN